jgi:UDP-N-acetylglucosamine--N-acetylmuramyl-(pentapeptide) pyrophosphoryl-undecaprenol N-acetylglucosamine transferase
VAPALAVADALRSRGVAVSFAGSPDRVEARLVPEAGYEFDSFRISGLPRRPSVALVRALLLAGSAPRACGRILAARRPDVVLGGGGYVAGPMVFAAALRRIPAALTEADAHLGLANRLTAPFARRVFLSFPIPGRTGPKYVVTGRPIPAASRVVERAEARRRFDLPADGPVVLVLGGSQGAQTLNALAVDAWAESGPAVLHQAGAWHYEALLTRISRPDYRLLPFTNEIGAAFGAADLVVSRAGGSIWEIAAAGKPAIVVPFPHATADHQTANALYFAGGVEIVADSDAARLVPGLVDELLADRERMDRMAAQMRALARPDAAEQVAEGVLELVEAHG